MEKRPIFPMTQLDTLVTTQELQLMKLMLPYIPANMRGMLAVYIKFTEFTNTIHLFHSTGNGSQTVQYIAKVFIHQKISYRI